MTKGSAHLAWDVGGQHALVRSEMLNSVSARGSGTVWQSPAAFGLRGTDRNAGLGRSDTSAFRQYKGRSSVLQGCD